MKDQGRMIGDCQVFGFDIKEFRIEASQSELDRKQSSCKKQGEFGPAIRSLTSQDMLFWGAMAASAAALLNGPEPADLQSAIEYGKAVANLDAAKQVFMQTGQQALFEAYIVNFLNEKSSR